MRASSWFKLIVKSGIGAGVIASAELGVAFALRIIDWTATPVDSTSLGRTAVWVVFIFATAVLGGVAVARHGVRLIRAAIAHRRALAAVARANVRGPVQVARTKALDAARSTAAVLTRIGAALAASVGAAAAFSLIWIPLRAAGVPGAQIRVVALAAAAGLALGFLLAVLALYAAPIAAGAAATAAWVWAFGLASVWLATAPEAGRPWTQAQPPRLGVLDAAHLINPDEWWFGPNLMVAISAGIAVAVAMTARWVGSPRLAVAVSGAAGPALVATSYVVVGPVPDLMPAYVASLLALTAGLVASTATAVAHRRARVRPTTMLTGAPVPAALAPSAAPTALAATAAPLAIESARTASPAPVTLEAEYAARQPSRGSVPVFEVTTKPAPPMRIPAPVHVPLVPAQPAPARPAPARTAPARPVPAQPVPAQPVPPQPVPAQARPAPPRKTPKTPKAPAKPAVVQPVAQPPARPEPATAGRAAAATGATGPDEKGQRAGRAKNARAQKQRGARQTRLDKREREHVDWVQNLVNLPNDPSLDLRSRP